jgi:hypothetical protein
MEREQKGGEEKQKSSELFLDDHVRLTFGAKTKSVHSLIHSCIKYSCSNPEVTDVRLPFRHHTCQTLRSDKVMMEILMARNIFNTIRSRDGFDGFQSMFATNTEGSGALSSTLKHIPLGLQLIFRYPPKASDLSFA